MVHKMTGTQTNDAAVRRCSKHGQASCPRESALIITVFLCSWETLQSPVTPFSAIPLSPISEMSGSAGKAHASVQLSNLQDMLSCKCACSGKRYVVRSCPVVHNVQDMLIRYTDAYKQCSALLQ